MRGGVSSLLQLSRVGGKSSPRAWGCFSVKTQKSYISPVFPTCVGVFLSSSLKVAFSPSLPHVRGGVSIACPHSSGLRARSSPRAWGCFLAICRLHVAIHGLPHVRGGVSRDARKRFEKALSSPRAWGCFLILSPRTRKLSVFPTCVGVFLHLVRVSGR